MLGDKSKRALTSDYFIDIITIIDDACTIKDLFDKVPVALGATVASYHHFGATGSLDFKKFNRHHAYNMPQEILDAESFNNEKENSGVMAVFSNGQFIWLSDLKDDEHVIETGYSEAVVYAMGLVGDGLCIPLFGPKYRHGYAFVAFGRGKSAFDPVMAFQVQAVMQKFHVRYCLMVESLQRKINLTPREAEVLELVSLGKTNSEIADILDISPNTVASYVSRVFLKLGVSDRISAVMRAQTLVVGF